MHTHRRLVILFLIAVVIPSLVLIVLTWRMIRQEGELLETRREEERRDRAREIGGMLQVRLEGIRLEELRVQTSPIEGDTRLGSSNPDVVLLGYQEGERLVLPWEQRSHRFQPDFERQIRRAEEEEFVHNRFDRAVAMYRALRESTRSPAEQAYSRLLQARALTRAGEKTEATTIYSELLSPSTGVEDEYGVPYAFYAADRLLETTAYEEVLHLIGSVLESDSWLSPTATYMLRGLMDTVADTTWSGTLLARVEVTDRMVNERIRDMEQVLALQNDFSNLMLIARREAPETNPESIWIPYGDNLWLVNVSESVIGTQPLVLIVSADRLLTSIVAENERTGDKWNEPQFVVGSALEGETLGPHFPGLKLVFSADESRVERTVWNRSRTFYLVVLVLVLSATVFGAYLLWWDVRRELNLAEMRSQFVASVSHELKTPLTSIRMFAETLRLGRYSDKKTQDEYLETIVNESERLSRLLNNVLDFSRIEQGRKRYRFASVSPAAIVRDAARAMQYPLLQQGFDLRVDITDNIPDMSVDRDAIEQAILNLLANALKYSGDSREVELRLEKDGDEVLILVRDHGVGILPEDRDRIFGKFYRASTTENERIPGTGLGLALVDHITRAHGGYVEVQSSPGQGSTFCIHLPIETDHEPHTGH